MLLHKKYLKGKIEIIPYFLLKIYVLSFKLVHGYLHFVQVVIFWTTEDDF